MNMKKSTAIILAAALALSLTGCGGGNSGNSAGTGNAGNTGGYSAASSERVTNKQISFSCTGVESDEFYYTGEWENGKPNGQGECVMNGSEGKAVYTGTFKNGAAQGSGDFLVELDNGCYNFLSGSFTNGIQSGSDNYMEVFDGSNLFIFKGQISQGAPISGELLSQYSSGYTERFVGKFSDFSAYNGDYQLYQNGELLQTGKYVDGDMKPDSVLAAEGILDDVASAIADHYGYGNLYRSLKEFF